MKEAEIISFLKLKKAKNGWYSGTCPFCRQDKFGLIFEKKDNKPPIYRCFRASCGHQGAVSFLMINLGRPDLAHDREFFREPDEELKNSIDVEVEEQTLEELPDVKLPLGWRRIFADDYLNARGFNQYSEYRVGLSKLMMPDYVIFPVDEFGKCKGYVSRIKKSKVELACLEASGQYFPRYKNSTSNFDSLVFGLDELYKANTAIIVEGIFDKFNVDNKLNLMGSEMMRCCATFGSSISNNQIMKIKQAGVKNVILMQDNDAISKSKKSSMLLSNFFNTLVAHVPFEEDPGEMTTEQFDFILSDLKTPLEYSSSFVNKKKLT